MKCDSNRFPQTIKMAVKHGCAAESAVKKTKKSKMETKALDGKVLTVGLPSGDRYLSTPLIQRDFLAASEGHLRPNEGMFAIDKASFYRPNWYPPHSWVLTHIMLQTIHTLFSTINPDAVFLIYLTLNASTDGVSRALLARADNYETCNRCEKETQFVFFSLLDFILSPIYPLVFLKVLF